MSKSRKPAKKPAKKSTALAVRKPQPARAEVVIHDPQHLMAGGIPLGQLGELATVGALGLVELKLTDAEERVLSRPVNAADILIRDGGIAYLPHIVYTRWFNDAFGRLGWAIVPTGKPQKGGNTVLVPYTLYVHGKPVAFAYGEQDYHENNSRQSYGDVIESTVASALRRCAKRLGVGLEMWDKAYLASIGKKPIAEPKRETPARASDTNTINEAQQKRLWNISRKAGRIDADVQLWLKQRYQVTATKDIRQSDYNAIVRQLEARGALALPGDGEA